MKIERETKKINGEGRIVLGDDILKEPNFQMLKKALGLGDDAVSYTHLDVYKRQE